MAAVEAGLTGLAVERRECPFGDEADVLRCHPAGYLAAVKTGGACDRMGATGCGHVSGAGVV